MIILHVINIAFILWGNIFKPNVSSYFLYVFICNLMVYFGYYCILKVVHKEPIPKGCYVIAMMALICWIPALYYFNKSAKSTNQSPAQSRNLNMECEISFFDTHDLWHFLSAGGLFLNFLLVLTIDDGITDKPRDSIHIF